MQVLQETDIIAEGRIKPRSAPAPAKKEGDAADSAEAPADTVAPAEAGAAAATEEPKPEVAAPTGGQITRTSPLDNKACEHVCIPCMATVPVSVRIQRLEDLLGVAADLA